MTMATPLLLVSGNDEGGTDTKSVADSFARHV